ncbi:MAG: branched-chain amino acid aminotransferase [Bacteroidia bacterium]
MVDLKKPPFKTTFVAASNLPKVDMNNIPFGKIFSDHMFVAKYENGQWNEGEVLPYGDISFAPSMSALHYGQAIFEGMKAYKNPQGEPQLFRPLDNWKRFNHSAGRLCMPDVPKDLFTNAIHYLVGLDHNWIPAREQGSLYIRPCMFATDEAVGVKASDSYLFVVFTSPVGPYYKEPVNLLATKEYTRAAIGGMGNAKAAGNYASALLPDRIAKKQGYHNVLWLDARLHQYIEECGTMNVFFVIEDTVVTPQLTGTILAGITRDSVIRLLMDNGYKVEKRRISIYELDEAYNQGEFQEAFGAGTAAVISNVNKIGFGGRDMTLPPVEERKISTWLYDTLYGIQTGILPDPYGWIVPVSKL